jgi:hypothetical protein
VRSNAAVTVNHKRGARTEPPVLEYLRLLIRLHPQSFAWTTLTTTIMMAAVEATSCSIALPSEIVLQILETGYYNHKFRPDRYYLNSCSQVCRLWAGQAQPLLFRYVEVRRPSSLAGLMETLTLPTHRRKALNETVLWLKIWVGFSDSVSRPAALLSLLAICPNLYGLSVTFRDMWMHPEDPLILPPNVMALECCDWECRIGPEVARVLIGSGWHSLRVLILRGNVPFKIISPHLVELRVEGPSDSSAFLYHWLAIAWPRANLRILEATDFLRIPGLIGSFQHTLESVHMAECISPEGLKDCSRLREFRIETFISRTLFLVLRDLPLEHLAYALVPTRSLDDFSRDCVSSLKALRVVSCLTSIRPWGLDMTNYIDDLEHICDRKQARLDRYTTLASFRALTV